MHAYLCNVFLCTSAYTFLYKGYKWINLVGLQAHLMEGSEGDSSKTVCSVCSAVGAVARGLLSITIFRFDFPWPCCPGPYRTAPANPGSCRKKKCSIPAGVAYGPGPWPGPRSHARHMHALICMVHVYVYVCMYTFVSKRPGCRAPPHLSRPGGLWNELFCAPCTSMYAYLYKGYRCNSNVTVTKVPFVKVCMHTCIKGAIVKWCYCYKGTSCKRMYAYLSKGTVVTITLLLQRYLLYKYVCIRVQWVPL